jgi:hypothetical protein
VKECGAVLDSLEDNIEKLQWPAPPGFPCARYSRLAVVAKYVPQLKFIAILLGDEPMLQTLVAY